MVDKKTHPFAEWRKLQRKTQEALADELGVATSTLIKWEHGTRRPRRNMQIAIERLTGGTISPATWAHY